MKKNSLILILVISFFFIGVEVIGREHTVDYDFFIKKHPTTQFTFSNPVLCGECDFIPYDAFNSKTKQKFQDLCYYRYDLQDIGKCEDLFNPEKQRIKI